MTDTLPPQGLKITAADIQGPETGAPDAKKIAAEIYLALREQSPSACVSGDPRDGEDCVIDGVFKLWPWVICLSTDFTWAARVRLKRQNRLAL
jgi:hypothetical protein